MTVWQSYRHENELFPATGQPSASFDAAPAYVYANVTGPCGSGDTNPNVFTNLDENSQLGLDYMFAQTTSSRTSSSPRTTRGNTNP